MSEPERLADDAAQQPLGALERCGGGGLLGDITEDRVVHRGLTQVRGDPRVGDRDHPETWILDRTDGLRDQFPYALRMFAHSGRICHLRTSASPTCSPPATIDLCGVESK
jgi:hypothetical protein